MDTATRCLSSVWSSIQRWLLPELAEEVGPLSETDGEFVRVVELCELDRHMHGFAWQGMGRKPAGRLALAKAFIAMRVYRIDGNKAMVERLAADAKLRRLCGWETPGEVPSESTFSRAFAAFARTGLPQLVHESMVKKNLGEKLVGHISRDSTAVEVREKPVGKEPPPGSGRPVSSAADTKAAPATPQSGANPDGKYIDDTRALEIRRLSLQPGRTLAENLADLPTACDIAAKRDSKGRQSCWVGYKLHVDTTDAGVPVSAILTSASVHDSQVAIPLAQMTTARVANCYDLMDAAYDAAEIRAFSQGLGHVPIIDHNPRRGEKREFEPATARRYNERSAAERTNSDLKDNRLPKSIRVRGAEKVAALLSFALLPIVANALYNMLR